MADRTSFVSVVDGDQLSQGYFNDIFTKAWRNVTSDQSSATTTSTTLIPLGTATVPAGTIGTSSDAQLLINVNGTLTGTNPPNGVSGSLRIRVGGTALFTRTVGGDNSSGALNDSISMSRISTASNVGEIIVNVDGNVSSAANGSITLDGILIMSRG